MKIFKFILLLVLSLSANAAPVAWNLGGYSKGADSAVVGGGTYADDCWSVSLGSGCGQIVCPQVCTAYSTGLQAFGIIAYDGPTPPKQVRASNTTGANGFTTYTGLSGKITCPENTAYIVVPSYVRSDTLTKLPSTAYVYSQINSTANGRHEAITTGVVNFVCVQSDTY